jgi:hypothetical protein
VGVKSQQVAEGEIVLPPFSEPSRFCFVCDRKTVDAVVRFIDLLISWLDTCCAGLKCVVLVGKFILVPGMG